MEERRVPDSAASVRVYRVEGTTSPRPALLWIHGGGYVLGAARQDDALCARFAQRLGAVVVSVEYRLAPANPFPAALDDCFAAWEYLHREAASLGVDASRTALGGASAGGGLAAGLAQRVFDAKAPAPRLQLLVYPMIDDRTTQREADGASLRLWSPEANRWGWEAYLGAKPGGESAPPYAAPARREDLAGLPPAWVGVGTRDLFLEEDLDYAERLRRAGVEVSVEVVEGAFHGFDQVLPGKGVSQRFFDAQARALGAALR